MAQDAAATGTQLECEAMGSVDSDQYVIAFPCRDDAWVSAPLANAASLSDWR